MGERKGTNKYYPPDFDYKKHKSLNAYHGTHALRERARKLDQGILIIRFELPYNIWCDGCKSHVAMGVRYNSQKTKVGMYYTTPIFQFRMKCHLCDNYIVMKTDPQNKDYVIVSGAKRKEQRWNMAENEQIVTEEKSDIKRLNTDPMFKLEHEVNDKSKLSKLAPTLVELQEEQMKWKDDYNLNSLMRQQLRGERKQIKAEKDKDNEFLKKWNIDINLVKEHEDDIKLASLYKHYSIKDDSQLLNNDINKELKRKKIEDESIFDAKLAKASSSASSAVVSSTNDSTASASTSKETKLANLHKKLSKSIEEKKLNELIDTSKDDSNSKKSFYFGVKTNNEKKTTPLYQKLSDSIKSKSTSNQTTTAAATANASLVSNDYDDDDNSESES